MIESIFQLKWVVTRHKQAPLLREGEQFLAHCQQQGTSHKAVHNMAPELIAVIRLLRLKELREARQLLYLRCQEMAAFSWQVEATRSATWALC